MGSINHRKVTVVKNVVSLCILLLSKGIFQSIYILGNGVLVEERIRVCMAQSNQQLSPFESERRPASECRTDHITKVSRSVVTRRAREGMASGGQQDMPVKRFSGKAI